MLQIREKHLTAKAYSLLFLLTLLVALCGCGKRETRQEAVKEQGATGQETGEEALNSSEPTGIMEPTASFEKINLDMKLLDNSWCWTGERVYFVERGQGGSLGNRILRAPLDGTSEETIYERQDSIFYHLFEGPHERLCFMCREGGR